MVSRHYIERSVSTQSFGLELRSMCASRFRQQMKKELFHATAYVDLKGFRGIFSFFKGADDVVAPKEGIAFD